MVEVRSSLFFFFNDTATTEIYTLSLHDALPICGRHGLRHPAERRLITGCRSCGGRNQGFVVCRDSTRGWPHLACEAATPDPAGLVPAFIEVRHPHAVASLGGVNEQTTADVDPVVTKVVEEDEVARLELIPRDPRS